MKRLFFFLAMAIFLSACQSPRQASAAFVGASWGGMLGSSIGGLMGGYRGRDVGSVVGVIAGGMVGGLLTAERDKQVDTRHYASDKSSFSRYDKSATLANHVDDALGFFPIEVRHLKFIDSNSDRAMNKGESCKIIFELVNIDTQAVYDVVPYLTATTASGRLSMSPAQHISMIGPDGVMRYTACVKANKKIKEKEVSFSLAISVQGGASKVVRNFSIPFKK